MGLFDFLKRKPEQPENDAAEEELRKAQEAYAAIKQRSHEVGDDAEEEQYEGEEDELAEEEAEQEYYYDEDEENTYDEDEQEPQVETDGEAQEEQSDVEPQQEQEQEQAQYEQPQNSTLQEQAQEQQPQQNGEQSFDMQEAQNEYLVHQNNKLSADLNQGFAKNQEGIDAVIEGVKATEQKVTGGISTVMNASGAIYKKVDAMSKEVSEKLEQNEENTIGAAQTILDNMNAQTEQLIEKIAAITGENDAELEELTPTQHYKNLKWSFLAFTMAVFAALLQLTSFIYFIGSVAANNKSPMLIVNFIICLLLAGGSIVMSFMQKNAFSKSSKLKEYLFSKNPVHSLSRFSLFTSMITILTALVMLIITIILAVV